MLARILDDGAMVYGAAPSGTETWDVAKEVGIFAGAAITSAGILSAIASYRHKQGATPQWYKARNGVRTKNPRSCVTPG